MKPPVKLLVVLTIFFFSAGSTKAQFKLSSSSGISEDIKKVIDDYPNHFNNITGELIINNPQSSEYQCNFKVDGAEECTITKYDGKDNTISSWQATMLTTENFNEAKKKFRFLYDQLNNLPNNAMHLKGKYEAPVEEKKFASVIFSFTPATESVKKLRVEVALEAQGMEWKVKVLVYDRDREDDERGNISGN